MRAAKVILTILTIALLNTTGFGQGKDFEQFPGRSNEGIKAVEIYPNPAIDYLNIKLAQPIANKVKLSLHNVIGNPIELETELLNDHEIKIRVKDLPTGYYLISVKDERLASAGTYKFLKR